ncbi:hypothetical protein NAP1_05130 [Erythrobacter sp. NAP1]|uniref:hypothetical protein n=1 Tax=Erythrobacter sp. NAP1 TaxID=237727 RepID=UPI0000686E44|nr:hypothetical protein [Erythrobacter sp. NAP1]EAQ30132.1 hypothetical protein NAP1_05130 [Erythrobacter sp. NAP1]
MRYDPKVPGEYERSRAYDLQWIGLPASLLWLGSEIFIAGGLGNAGLSELAFVPAICAAMSLAWPLGTLADTDEFVQRQHLAAASWGLAVAGLVAMLRLFPFVRDWFPQIEATMAIALIASAYNLALVAGRLREGFSGNE